MIDKILIFAFFNLSLYFLFSTISFQKLYFKPFYLLTLIFFCKGWSYFFFLLFYLDSLAFDAKWLKEDSGDLAVENTALSVTESFSV